MVCLDVYRVSNLEVRCQSSSGIGRTLIVFLCFGYLVLEFLVYVVEVYRKFSSSCGGKVPLGVYCDVGVISFIRKEWGDIRGCTWSVIVSKFHDWEKSIPIVLLVVAVNAEVLFQGLVGAFGLSVAFWVVSGSETKLHIESFSERPEEV